METETRNTSRLLLRLPEAAAMLGVCKRTLYQIIARGELPTVRFGKRGVRIPLAEVHAWIARQSHATEASK